MKFDQIILVFTVVLLSSLLLPANCYGGSNKFRYPTRRMLQSTGDISLPANNFTMDDGMFEIYYEFSVTNETLSGDNSTNTTTNGTDTTNSTIVDNSTVVSEVNNTATEAVGEVADVASAVDSTATQVTEEAGAAVDNIGAEVANVTDTNSTDATNSTDGLNATNGTNGTNSTEAPQFVTIAIKFNSPSQFFAVGFGASGMTGADIWTFEFEDSAVVVTDRIALGHFSPDSDVDNGGVDNLEVLGYEITDTYTLVKLRRACDTGDSTNDKLIQPGTMNWMWAYQSGQTMRYHGNNRGVISQDLVYTA